MSRVMSSHEMKDAAGLGWKETAKKTIGVYNEVLGI